MIMTISASFLLTLRIRGKTRSFSATVTPILASRRSLCKTQLRERSSTTSPQDRFIHPKVNLLRLSAWSAPQKKPQTGKIAWLRTTRRLSMVKSTRVPSNGSCVCLATITIPLIISIIIRNLDLIKNKTHQCPYQSWFYLPRLRIITRKTIASYVNKQKKAYTSILCKKRLPTSSHRDSFQVWMFTQVTRNISLENSLALSDKIFK